MLAAAATNIARQPKCSATKPLTTRDSRMPEQQPRHHRADHLAAMRRRAPAWRRPARCPAPAWRPGRSRGSRPAAASMRGRSRREQQRDAQRSGLRQDDAAAVVAVAERREQQDAERIAELRERRHQADGTAAGADVGADARPASAGCSRAPPPPCRRRSASSRTSQDDSWSWGAAGASWADGNDGYGLELSSGEWVRSSVGRGSNRRGIGPDRQAR